MSIRPAIKDDCAAIAEIYNHAVVHTAAIWNDKTVDTDNRIAWFEARQLAGFPVLVNDNASLLKCDVGDGRITARIYGPDGTVTHSHEFPLK